MDERINQINEVGRDITLLVDGIWKIMMARCPVPVSELMRYEELCEKEHELRERVRQERIAEALKY